MQKASLDWVEEDRSAFEDRKEAIREALVDLKTGMLDSVTDDNKKDVFYMMCFCLLVPQSKQIYVEEVIDKLKELDFYHKSLPLNELGKILSRKVRFHNRKSLRLEAARSKFVDSPELWNSLKKRSNEYHMSSGNGRMRVLLYSRDWLVREIDGMGLKLASHFLRNIGMRGLAILDVHVLRALEDREKIADYNPLTKDRYYGIEEILKQYADQVGISLDELDQLFWSNATGYVGK